MEFSTVLYSPLFLHLFSHLCVLIVGKNKNKNKKKKNQPRGRIFVCNEEKNGRDAVGLPIEAGKTVAFLSVSPVINYAGSKSIREQEEIHLWAFWESALKKIVNDGWGLEIEPERTEVCQSEIN